MPRAMMRALAAWLGRVYHLLHAPYRRVVAANLAKVFPGEPEKVRALTRQTFLQFARSLADYCALGNLDPAYLQNLFEQLRGAEHLTQALKHGRGVILVTAHLGNWELGGLFFALKGYKINAVTLEEHMDQLTVMREQYRSVHGIRTIRIGSSPFSFIDVMAALRRNEIVAMLVERPYASASVEVEFFGKPTPFSNGPVMLALGTGAVILPGFVYSNRDEKYCGEIREAIPLDSFEDHPTAVRHNTQKIARVFESVIREHPDQWYNFVPLWRGQ